MKKKLRTPAVAEVRRRKSAVAGAGWPKRAVMKSVKSVKWFFAIFQLQPAAAQAVPTKMRAGDFTDFPQILRGCMGGRGSRNPNPNLNPILNGWRVEL